MASKTEVMVSPEVFSSEYRATAVRPRQTSELRLLVADVVWVWLAALYVLRLRFPVPLRELTSSTVRRDLHLTDNLIMILLFSAFVALFCNARKLYRAAQTLPTLAECIAVVQACGAAAVLLWAVSYLARTNASRMALGLTVMMSAFVLVASRLARRKMAEQRVTAGVHARTVLIVGAGKVGRALERYLTINRQLGYSVRGFVEVSDSPAESADVTNVLGTMAEIRNIVVRHFVEEIFITVPERRDMVKEVTVAAREHGIDVRVVPDLYDGLAWGAPVEYIGMFPTMALHQEYIPALALGLKRVMDVLGAAVGLVALSPIMLATTIAIKLDSEGPVLYRSERIGKKGSSFICYKFRTMVANAEVLKESMWHLNERTGVLFKVKLDPRITRVGSFLRRYSLDELPQLWNVLKGDMSLVGPRPPIPGEYSQYEMEHLKRLQVLPGITGLWQVEARQDPSFESYINLDTEYVEHWTIWLDMKILVKTLVVVMAGTGQ